MSWQTLHAPQRPMPRGQVAIPFAGRAISLTDSEKHYRGRWRD